MMKTTPKKQGKPGYTTFLMVLSVGTVALMLSLYTYRQAIATHEVAATIQLKTDYREKEDAILRSLVAILPNRAIRTMKGDSLSSYENYEPLFWPTIFNDAIDLANARTSVAADFKAKLNLDNLVISNTGDSALANTYSIFTCIPSDTSDLRSSYMSPGINRDLTGAYPPPLESGNSMIRWLDAWFPIISTQKTYGNLASGDVGLSVTEYPDFNLLKYPQINFGYAEPGEDFVAKRNWWAFSMDLAKNDDAMTHASSLGRNFVLSIYEIPSQLAISAEAFMSLGEFGTGEDWKFVTISGGVFAGKALVEGDTNLDALSSRRGMEISSSSSIGGQNFATNPFSPGLREAYQLTEGDFFPVSLASEGGRVAFIPINRGVEFFDRFATPDEVNTISPTTWNDYSIGARQCAMRLDITECVDATDPTPTEVRFTYYQNGVRRTMDINLLTSGYTGLPSGYLYACKEENTYDFGEAVVDLAYGTGGSYAFEAQATGEVTFNNDRFGDPAFGFLKSGYYRPSYPFEIRTLDNGKICVALYPERFESFLDAIQADDTSINNSIAINVDYSTSTGSINLPVPSIPCAESDYGVVIEECGDFTSFPKGFSLVTNLRTYIGSDFNITPATPPAGYIPSEEYYPPVSLFAPEKRFGIDVDPYSIDVYGQIGSLAKDDGTMIRPLDSKAGSGARFGSNRIRVNLKPIAHPAELPPITMMNWLITVEEVRSEFSN